MASPARPPFAFSPRTLKLNWRSVAAIDIADVEQRAARGDVDVLESHLETVHFADTTDERASNLRAPCPAAPRRATPTPLLRRCRRRR